MKVRKDMCSMIMTLCAKQDYREGGKEKDRQAQIGTQKDIERVRKCDKEKEKKWVMEKYKTKERRMENRRGWRWKRLTEGPRASERKRGKRKWED